MLILKDIVLPKQLFRFYIAALCMFGSSICGAMAKDTTHRTGDFSEEVQTPLLFEHNIGQFQSDGEYVLRTSAYVASFQNNAFSVSIGSESVSFTFENSNSQAYIKLEKGLNSPAKHYYSGSDPKKWKTGVALGERLVVDELYEGIDVIFYINEGELQYDFQISPGSDPDQIRMKVEGHRSITVAQDGRLIVESYDGTDIGSFTAPLTYQTTNKQGERDIVASEFTVTQNQFIGFTVGEYDRQALLTIDPKLTVSTYLGGTGTDEVKSMVVTSDGFVYVTGDLSSNDIHGALTGSGDQTPGDVYVSKFTSNGSLLWTSIIAGPERSESKEIIEAANGEVWVGVESDGQLSVAGGMTENGSKDVYLARLDSNGGLVFSTFFGGTETEEFGGMVLDSSSNLWIVGATGSQIPVTIDGNDVFKNNLNAGFYTQISDTGVVSYSSYWEGSTASSSLQDIEISPDGLLYLLTVDSYSYYQSTVVTLDNSRSLNEVAVFERIGESDFTGSVIYDIAVDDQGIWAVGRIRRPVISPINPLKSFGGDFDGVIVYKEHGGDYQLYSAFGGNRYDVFNSVTSDGFGGAWVTGYTESTDFPVFTPAYQRFINNPCIGFGSNGQCGDAFVHHFRKPADGAFGINATKIADLLIENTFIGGNGTDRGQKIVVADGQDVWVAGSTGSSNFPVVNGFNNGNGFDGFISKFETAPGVLLKAGTWHQLSLPIEPPAGATVGSIFGRQINGVYGTDWIIFRYNPILNPANYEALSLNDSLSTAEGFWIIQNTGRDIPIYMPQGSREVRPFFSSAPLSGVTHSGDVMWNMIGTTLRENTDFSDMFVLTESGRCSSPFVCFMDVAFTEDIVGNFLFHYNGVGYDVINTSEGKVEPWKGYWAAELAGAQGNGAKIVFPGN